jgi:tetratricopeptide (TPR) repeat protein
MRDTKSEMTAAKAAYREEHFNDALEMLERILSEPPHDESAIYLAARIYESGNSSHGVDYEKALDYYQRLARDIDSDISSIGAIGCARTLSKKDCCANQHLIESYCLRAIEINGSISASFILGQMYEQCQGKYKLARQHYLRMFRYRRPLGLRYYARSHMKYGSTVIGILAHVATTLVSPIYFIINKRAIHPEIDR